MKNKFKGKMSLFVLFAVALFFLVSAMVMALWNWLLPEILGVKAITFWQAVGILILSKILFGGFGGKKGCGGDKFRRLKEERMSGMSGDEKQRLREIWRKRCDTGFFRDKC